VLELVVDEAVEEDEAPLMLELHASSSPPPPTTAALAPAARSRPRRLNPPMLLVMGDDAPTPPRKGDVPSVCAVWSLIVQSISFEVAPRRGTAYEVTP
jgi:hypothetical protein